MTRWMKRVTAAAVMLTLALSLGAAAYADGEVPAEPADETEALSVTLDVQNEVYKADLAATNIGVQVYKVATGDEYGQYTLTADFAALADDAAWSAAWNGGSLTGDTNLEDLLTAVVAAMGLTADETSPAPGETAPSPEPTEEPAATLTATPIFDGTLAVVGGTVPIDERGLYLVAPQQTAETDLWKYTFSPILLPVPGVSEGAWQYAVTVQMKPTQERRLVSLEIEKYLATYNRSLGPATFVFDVVGTLDGEVVYRSTERLTFTDDASARQTVTVENIPAGAQVTVTEVYTGQSYTNTDGTVEVVVVDPGNLPEGQDVHRVAFSNDYAEGLIPDAAVENVFTMVGDGWQWHSEKGSEEAG